ncbi:MAG: hypothetical protein HC872_05240, partial [Gammaproteobacteria bacterium]|nr:hypothetical protein [Gammaproteobacteria bacterium]
MRTQPIKIVAAACAAILSLSAVNALAQSDDGVVDPPQGVILKWKTGALLQNGGAVAAARVLSDTQARYGVSMRQMRRIATGAEVINFDRNLTQAELDDLVATLNNDPNVEYAEPDRVMRRSSRR